MNNGSMSAKSGSAYGGHKKTAIFALLAALTIPLNIALAHEDTSETDQDATASESQRELNKEALKARQEQKKQELETQKEQRKQAAEALKEKNRKDRCKNIETRVDTRINRYENNLGMFRKVFGNMRSRLTRLSARLETALTAAGITDKSKLAKLTADIATLDTMIQKLDTDYSAFITTLTTIKTSTATCETTAVTALSSKTGEARKVIGSVKQDRLAIRDFFNTTIKQDLKAIRAQLPADSVTPEAAETPKNKKASVGTAASETPVTTENQQ